MNKSNGVASKATTPATSKPAGNLQPIPQPKIVAPFTKVETGDLPPLDDRIQRLNQLFKIQGDYNKLQESLTKLNEFVIKNDGESSRLTLRDDMRTDFTTSHPEIIGEVIDFLKGKIREKIKTIEPKLIW